MDQKLIPTQFLPKAQVLIKFFPFWERTAFGNIINHLVTEVRDLEGKEKEMVKLPLHKKTRGICKFFFFLMGKVGSRSRKGEKRELPVGRWGLGDHAQLC